MNLLLLSYVSPDANNKSSKVGWNFSMDVYYIYILYGCYIYAINSTEKFTGNYDEIAGIIVRNGRSVRCNIKTYVKYRRSITFVTFSE